MDGFDVSDIGVFVPGIAENLRSLQARFPRYHQLLSTVTTHIIRKSRAAVVRETVKLSLRPSIDQQGQLVSWLLCQRNLPDLRMAQGRSVVRRGDTVLTQARGRSTPRILFDR